MSDMQIYRLHTKKCQYNSREDTRCRCPLHLDAVINSVRVQVSLGTRSWAEAETNASKVISREQGHTKTVSEAIEAFQLHNRVRGLRPSTIVSYNKVLNSFGKFCEDQVIGNMDEISLAVLDGFRASRSDYAISTSVKNLDTLQAFFGFSVERAWMPKNLMAGIKRPKIPDNEVEPYTEAEKAQIMFAAERVGFHEYERNRVIAALWVMRETGLRISDVLKLSRDRVKDVTISVFTQKNNRAVQIRVSQSVLNALERLTPPRGADPGCRFYFWNAQSSFHTIETDMQRVLHRVYELAGVKRAKNHRFRHTFISELLASGATERVVSDVVGVSEAILRKHYSKWMPARQDRIDEAVQKRASLQSAQQVPEQPEPASEVIQ